MLLVLSQTDLQVLTALELARQARIAANRAYLAGLGLGPQAMHTGQVGSLRLTHERLRPGSCCYRVGC